MKGKELQSFICKACVHITKDENYSNKDITPELLFEMRERIVSIQESEYKFLFPNAFENEENCKAKGEKPKYDYDGCGYRCVEENGDLYVTAIRLYEEEVFINLSNKTPCCGDYRIKNDCKGEYSYYYKNELDHFMTHYIVNYLEGKGCSRCEPGLELVKKEIENR